MALEVRQGRPTASTRRRRPGGEQKKRIEDVLERLALTDPSDLCSEAKAEKCWALRDLRSCGRPVKHLLTSCKHASLCAECSQRCDACPVCKTPISRAQPVLRLRLYDECVEAGLLPLIGEDEFRAREKEGPYWTYDSWRLCSFFDAALQNNLASVVCHYVTDVCMDEAAVSSDPVISMLLDGAIVKEWCRRTLVSIVRSLREIYASNRVNKADSLSKEHRKLEGLCNVLETLEASLDSGLFLELQQLLDGVRMISQHLELMEWCIRHRNLSSVPCCYSSIQEWRLAFQDRKHAAASRAWPDYLVGSGTLGSKPSATLFIEDAMQNIGIDDEDEFSNEYVDLLRHGGFTYASYPPDAVTAAADLLFLRGAPDLFLAKKATFLYYLYDRHWKYPEPDHEPAWEAVIDDYANTFSIPRQSMLESFVFYLLDNNTGPALEKACCLLPEIVSPSLHPKVSRVLLERGRANVSHTVLQATGRFGLAEGVPAAPLSEAVTAVRVWVKCGLAKEAFNYVRRHRKAVKTAAMQQEDDALSRDWVEEMEVLIGELCSLCIQQNCVNDLLELPWQQADEEKILKKCFLEHVLKDPPSVTGSLLVVFYLQRCRFLEASSVHQNLQHIEQEFIRNCGDMEKVTQLQRTSEHRTRLLEKCLEQLPEVERDRQHETISEDFTEAMQQDEVLDSSRINKQLSLTREQFSPFISKKQQQQQQQQQPPMQDTTAFSQALPTQMPAKSPMFPSPLLNGFDPAPQSPPRFSPLLGKRLRYETELLEPFRHLPNGGEAAPPGSATKKGAAQPMVVTW